MKRLIPILLMAVFACQKPEPISPEIKNPDEIILETKTDGSWINIKVIRPDQESEIFATTDSQFQIEIQKKDSDTLVIICETGAGFITSTIFQDGKIEDRTTSKPGEWSTWQKIAVKRE